jgi:hypothetical protein
MVYPEPRRQNLLDYAYYHEIHAIREALSALRMEPATRADPCRP